jgi:hypothetical protein
MDSIVRERDMSRSATYREPWVFVFCNEHLFRLVICAPSCANTMGPAYKATDQNFAILSVRFRSFVSLTLLNNSNSEFS